MNSKSTRQERSFIAVEETVDAQQPVVLASGNEAVAAIAEKLMKLTPSQRAFLRLRFYFESDAACATRVGLAPSTIRQWKVKDARFNTAYEELLTQPLLHARAEFLMLTEKAVHMLGDLLDSPNPQVRLAAAEKVLKSRDAQLLTNTRRVARGRA